MAAKNQEVPGGRRSERMSLNAETRLRPNGWSSLEIRMRDLSETGFRARCEARLQPGSCVSIDVPGIGAVEAQVEWRRGDEFGARFLQPIELARCGWSLGERQSSLARLLVDRAQAKGAGRSSAEAQLRRHILAGLPIRRGVASA